MHKVPDHHSEKARLRRELRQSRTGIDEQQRAVLDAAINRHLLEYARAARLSDIAVYLSFDGEPDLTPAMNELDEYGITLALPVVREVSGRNTLVFRQWTRNCKLRPNRYGILEPFDTTEIPLLRFDVILMPLVGWDRRGSRLGMGGSYYDRALQPFTRMPRPMRMGVAYESQESAAIPLDPWDIRMHAMLTEKGWFTCDL
jgi:5-formyltetrahydrofolate cyclo-ligase